LTLITKRLYKHTTSVIKYVNYFDFHPITFDSSEII